MNILNVIQAKKNLKSKHNVASTSGFSVFCCELLLWVVHHGEILIGRGFSPCAIFRDLLMNLLKHLNTKFRLASLTSSQVYLDSDLLLGLKPLDDVLDFAIPVVIRNVQMELLHFYVVVTDLSSPSVVQALVRTLQKLVYR